MSQRPVVVGLLLCEQVIMNDSRCRCDFPEEGPGFDSQDRIFFISDDPGDSTVCSPTPLLLRIGRAEQERLARCQQSLPPPATADGPY